ncbi:MAG TPA: HD domain-containing protein [Myxococcota bacterium]|nr:HD domain-containing protein [Myxococcota bacterium]
MQSDTKRVPVHPAADTHAEHALDRALRLAVQVHSGTVDRAGRPYLLHILQVVTACRDDLDAATVAALHDVVEDSSVTCRDLREQGFAAHLVEAVDALTRRDGESYEDSIERASRLALSRKVKLADLESNLDVRRLTQVTSSDLGRLERYRKAWHQLRAMERAPA